MSTLILENSKKDSEPKFTTVYSTVDKIFESIGAEQQIAIVPVGYPSDPAIGKYIVKNVESLAAVYKMMVQQLPKDEFPNYFQQEHMYKNFAYIIMFCVEEHKFIWSRFEFCLEKIIKQRKKFNLIIFTEFFSDFVDLPEHFENDMERFIEAQNVITCTFVFPPITPIVVVED